MFTTEFLQIKINDEAYVFMVTSFRLNAFQIAQLIYSSFHDIISAYI